MEQTSQSSQVLPCVSILYVYICHDILDWEDEATYPAYHRFHNAVTSIFIWLLPLFLVINLKFQYCAKMKKTTSVITIIFALLESRKPKFHVESVSQSSKNPRGVFASVSHFWISRFHPLFMIVTVTKKIELL